MTLIDDRTRKILADPEKRHAWAAWQLKLKGISLAAIAYEQGLHRTSAYAAFHRRYPRMEALIAKALDMRPQDLFPERYDEQGRPLKWLGAGKPRPMPDSKHTTRTKRGNGRSTDKKQPGIKESQAA